MWLCIENTYLDLFHSKPSRNWSIEGTEHNDESDEDSIDLKIQREHPESFNANKCCACDFPENTNGRQNSFIMSKDTGQWQEVMSTCHFDWLIEATQCLSESLNKLFLYLVCGCSSSMLKPFFNSRKYRLLITTVVTVLVFIMQILCSRHYYNCYTCDTWFQCKTNWWSH